MNEGLLTVQASVPLDAPDFRYQLSGRCRPRPSIGSWRRTSPSNSMARIRTARTVRRYDPTDTWVQFLWYGLSAGLMEALKE